jgi:hypothetical protein
MERTKIRWLISVHQMSILGEFFKTWYTPVITALVIYQALSGLYMLTVSFTRLPKWRPVNNSLFTLHYNIAIFAGLPLLYMAVTGGGYRFLKNVLGYDGTKIAWLLTFHKLEFFGLGYIWPLIAAICIIALVAVGAPLNFINQMQIEIKKEEIQ